MGKGKVPLRFFFSGAGERNAFMTMPQLGPKARGSEARFIPGEL